jgi:hypothetical protein
MFDRGGRNGQWPIFLSAMMLHRSSNRTMYVLGIYGHAGHLCSCKFLEELTLKISLCNRPLLMGGDFNLIRPAEDKNNDNLNWSLMDLFDDNKVAWALREIPRTGERFSWTNR